MWFSLFVQIATLIIMLSLLFMQRMIPDLLWGIFMTSMFICIILSTFVQSNNADAINTKGNQQSNFKVVLIYTSLIVPIGVLLFIS